MNITRLIFGAIAVLFFAAPVSADKLSLDEISAYLNKLVTAKADFTQINADGSTSTGEIFIRRPGRIRFDYDPPDTSLVIASQGQVVIFDGKSNQTPERFPLIKTPLSLILANNVNLRRARMVVGHTFDGTSTSVIAQDPKHPEYGRIQMVFGGDPVELQQWIVTDGTGQNTVVILGEFQTGISLSARVFDVESELQDRRY